MQFSENWLRSQVQTDLSSAALSHALTMAGLEVEDMQAVAAPFSHVVVAKILSAVKHPDADRLQVCQVDVGLAEPLQIVCGASNARIGLVVPCAMAGAALPGILIKQAKVRGIDSFGMLCSSKELGLTAEATGLLELADDAIVGQDIRDYLDLNDHIFTLKLTPNRSDCLSILGIARDVTAITGAKNGASAVVPVIANCTDNLSVSIQASAACPRYCGRLLRGINAKAPTPAWMLKRLERSGLRSISAVVDVTNYVLMLLGQPMHAFDADRLTGDITVRFANPDEAMLLLNEQNVALKSDDLVICDAAGPIALAGIMGGKAASVTDETQTIFLESAFFSPQVMAGKARRLGLSTDSSYRFERGVDFANTRAALEYATALILAICGGQMSDVLVGEVTEVVGALPTRRPVTLRMARLNSVLGVTFNEAQVITFLTQLDFHFSLNVGVFTVNPPSYRFDIAIEEDLIEEVARLHGYDQIPAIAPDATMTMLPAYESTQHPSQLRAKLVSAGYQEVINYSFVDESCERDLLGNTQPIKLKNPIASHLSVMRTSLWGGLLDSLAYNLKRQQARAFLFEIGATYFQTAQTYQEHTKIAGLAYGTHYPEQWASDAREVDFFDLKAHIETLIGTQVQYEKATHAALHPGQTARIFKNGQAIGFVGKLHPKWQQQYHVSKSAYLFELDLAAVTQCAMPSYQEVSKLLPVRRDLAVVVDENVSIKALLDAVKEANIPLLLELALFDLYQGKGIAENKKSLALSVLMHDTQKTLTDVDADNTMANLLQLLQNKFAAALRN